MKPLHNEQVTFEPTQKDIDFYNEHGWFISPELIPHHLLDEAAKALEMHWAGNIDHPLPIQTGFCDWKYGDESSVRNNEYISLQNKKFRKLSLHPALGTIAAKLSSSSYVRVFDDQVVYKPSHQSGSAVGWHVDYHYWQTCSSQQMTTAWIPFQDCTLELGPLVVLDGSHKWSHLLNKKELSFHSQDMQSLEKHIRSLGFDFKPIFMTLKKGQFSLHHCLALHGSFPNKASVPRIAYAVHIQDESNHYVPAFHPDGNKVTLFNDRICRQKNSIPDYTDSNVFPVIPQFNAQFSDRGLQL